MIVAALAHEKFDCDMAHDGETAFRMAKEGKYGVILLDLAIPERHGYDVIAGLRAVGVRTPILIISARSFVEDRVRGLDLGADDYLVKNFSLQELTARVKSLLRRTAGSSSNILRCGDLTLNLTDMRVMRAGRTIRIPRKEFAILACLLRSKNSAVSRDALLREIWGEVHQLRKSNILDVQIRSLRRHVDDGHPKKLIHTVRGHGYMIHETGGASA